MEVVGVKKNKDRTYSTWELSPIGNTKENVLSGVSKEEAEAYVPKALERRQAKCKHLREVRDKLHTLDKAEGKRPREFDPIVE